MKPTDFPQANFTWNRPYDMTDEECEPLRAYRAQSGPDGAYSVSRWMPSEEERAAIAAGGPVWLYVFGTGHPPVSVTARSPFPKDG